MNKKRTLIVLAIIITVALIGIIIYFAVGGRRSASDSTDNTEPVTLRVDPDTGEQTTDDPSIHTESEDVSSVSVLGVEDLINKADLGRQQILFLKEQMQSYGFTTLKDKYATLTIRPQDTVVSDNDIKSTVRLGDTDTFVNFEYRGIGTGPLQILITDPTGKNGGNFTSPTEDFFESS